jgi:molecular chaperone DnaK
MVKSAEEHASDDKKRREEIERRNRLDAMIYEVEKNSKEWADRLEQSHRDRLNAAIDGGKKALRSGATDEIQKALEELTQAYSAAGATLYQGAQATGDAKAAGGPTGDAGTTGPAAGKNEAGKKDVVDADYEIVDDSKT